MIELIQDLQVVHSTPILHMKNSKGLTKYWQGFAVTDGVSYFIKSHAWQQTKDGGLSKVNESVPNRVAGKNIGRANETTPHNQAIFEITSRMNKKRDEGYVEEGEIYVGYPLPMLAHKYTERAHDIEFPCYVQPKLDGQRAVTDGSVYWTRKGKEYIPKVVEHTLFDTERNYPDGEFMLPFPFCFDDTEKAVKKFIPEDKPEYGKECGLPFHSKMLIMHIFDVMVENVPFCERIHAIKEYTCIPSIEIVPTYLVRSEAEAMEKYAEFLELGYEGIIFRNSAGLYRTGARSKDLQKFKPDEDDEFLVVDIVDGRGKAEGAALYVCVTPDGKQFTCTPKGTLESRREIFQRKDEYIGKMLTIKYQRLSADGIPIFLRGIGFKPDRN